MIGISGPSTLMVQLSMPSPAIADNKCSIVDILISSSIRAVERLVSPTYSTNAGILIFSSISVLMKCIPESGSDGSSSILSVLPV